MRRAPISASAGGAARSRRFGLLALLGAAAVAACAADPPRGPGRDGGAGDAPLVPPTRDPVPFGSHGQIYAGAPLRPRGTPAELDGVVRRFYDQWRALYVQPGCGGFLVRTQGGTGAAEAITISEAHGYGMMLLPLMAGHDPEARATFDGFVRVLRAFPSRINRDLMSWAIGPRCTPIDGQNSATDGDLDLAYGLLLAHRQWGSTGAVDYLGEARKVVAAIAKSDFNSETSLPLLGDWATSAQYYYSTRPSDFMPDHFRVFAPVAGAALFESAVDRTYQVVEQLQAVAPTGLVPDFAVGTNSDVRPAPPAFLEGSADGDFSFNACRIPWRLGTDYLVSGDARARKALGLMTAWLKKKTGGEPSKMASGYSLDGSRELQGGASGAFVGPFAVGAMVAAATAEDQAWLDALWRWMAETPPQEYYADSIRLLSMIVVSGNWLAP